MPAEYRERHNITIKSNPENQLKIPMDDPKWFNWIGISIDMKTMSLVPNMILTKEAILCSLNVNISTNKSVLWLKRKLKSFLMNNVAIYFRPDITSKDYAKETLAKIFIMAAEKYAACCKVFRRFHVSNLRN